MGEKTFRKSIKKIGENKNMRDFKNNQISVGSIYVNNCNNCPIFDDCPNQKERDTLFYNGNEYSSMWCWEHPDINRKETE